VAAKEGNPHREGISCARPAIVSQAVKERARFLSCLFNTIPFQTVSIHSTKLLLATVLFISFFPYWIGGLGGECMVFSYLYCCVDGVVMCKLQTEW
jgi:hypothetical protein